MKQEVLEDELVIAKGKFITQPKESCEISGFGGSRIKLSPVGSVQENTENSQRWGEEADHRH